MKKFLTWMILIFAGQLLAQNTVYGPQIKRIYLDSTATKVVWFAFPPAPGYALVSPDTSVAYASGQTAVINPPDAVKWSGNATIRITPTYSTAEESDSLQVWIKGIGYDGKITSLTDSTFCDFTGVETYWTNTANQWLNWTSGKTYYSVLSGRFGPDVKGFGVYLQQKAFDTATADTYVLIELTVY